MLLLLSCYYRATNMLLTCYYIATVVRLSCNYYVTSMLLSCYHPVLLLCVHDNATIILRSCYFHASTMLLLLSCYNNHIIWVLLCYTILGYLHVISYNFHIRSCHCRLLRLVTSWYFTLLRVTSCYIHVVKGVQ